MKLLYCNLCSDIISPYREAYRPRACECGEYVVWWTDSHAGILRVHTHTGDYQHAHIIGIHNSLLNAERSPTISDIASMMKGIRNEPHSLFGRSGSLIVRFSPGHSDDTNWCRTLPKYKEK